MPKTAILVTFQATTRIVIDVPDDVTLKQYLDNRFNWSSVSRTARNKMQGDLGDYLCGDNMSVEEDTEILAAPIEAIDVDPEKRVNEI